MTRPRLFRLFLVLYIASMIGYLVVGNKKTKNSSARLFRDEKISELVHRRQLETLPEPGYKGNPGEGPAIGEEEEEEHENEGGEGKIPITSGKFWIYVGICVFLIAFAGMFSGLTVGYMGIDPLEMQVKLNYGTDEEKKMARNIKPLLDRHHVLLSTLLLGNSLCFEALPIFMDRICPSWLAVLLSTTVILIFGEVLPQAYCTGPDQIKIAASLSPVVKFFVYLFLPVTYYIAKGLDKVLGEHGGNRYTRKTLFHIMELNQQEQEKIKNERGEEMSEIEQYNFAPEELNIISSTIDMREQPLTKIMIKLKDLYVLDMNTKLTYDLSDEIFDKGFSRIPLFKQDKSQIVGVLLSKRLMKVRKFIDMPITAARPLYVQPVYVAQDQTLLELLSIFERETSSIAFVTNKSVRNSDGDPARRSFYGKLDHGDKHFEVIGMVTLHDLFEEIVKKELNDKDQVKRGEGEGINQKSFMRLFSARKVDNAKLQRSNTFKSPQIGNTGASHGNNLKAPLLYSVA